VRNGPSWHHNPIVGFATEKLFDRAYMSLFGAFADDRTVQAYLTANHDSDGRPLAMGRHYRILLPRGKRSFPATWWDLTPYERNRTLVPNASHVYAVSSEALPDEEGPVELHFSPEPPAGEGGTGIGRWAPTGPRPSDGEPAVPLGFLVRLFHPDVEALAGFASLALPIIERVDDGEIAPSEAPRQSLLPAFWQQNRSEAPLAPGFHDGARRPSRGSAARRRPARSPARGPPNSPTSPLTAGY
jgi:hypothetical protein